jgi:hypothetical protein
MVDHQHLAKGLHCIALAFVLSELTYLHCDGADDAFGPQEAGDGRATGRRMALWAGVAGHRSHGAFHRRHDIQPRVRGSLANVISSQGAADRLGRVKLALRAPALRAATTLTRPVDQSNG